MIQGERGNLIATLQFFTGAVDPWCNKVTETSCDISLSPLGGENIDGTGNACNWSCYRNSRLLAVEPETPKLCITAHMSLFPASAVALDFLDLRFWRKRN